MSAFSGFRTVVCVWVVCLNLLGSLDPAGQMPLPCPEMRLPCPEFNWRSDTGLILDTGLIGDMDSQWRQPAESIPTEDVPPRIALPLCLDILLQVIS